MRIPDPTSSLIFLRGVSSEFAGVSAPKRDAAKAKNTKDGQYGRIRGVYASIQQTGKAFCGLSEAGTAEFIRRSFGVSGGIA
jgi:hypothetical protein